MNFAAERTRAQVAVGAVAGSFIAIIAVSSSTAAKVGACAVAIAYPLLWWMLCESWRWLAVFFISALLLPALPLNFGDSGPHIALLFAACGLLIGLVHSFTLVLDKLSISLLALLSAIGGSIAMAGIYSGFEIAAASAARVMLFGISIYVFFFVRGSHVPFKLVRVLFWTAAGSAAFACLDFYFQFPAPGGYGPQFIWLESGVFRRAQGVFYEASTLGNLCAFFLQMIAVALFRPRDQRPLPMFTMLTGGIFLTSALVLSYSRASLVNLAVGLATLLWLERKRLRFGRPLMIAGASAAVAAALLLGLFPLFAKAYWLRIAQSFSYFLESPNAILSGRINSWTILTQFLLAHPWHGIFGIGYKTLPYSDFIGQTAIADNTYLSMLMETGIAGLGTLIIWNAAVIRYSYRAAQSDDGEQSFCGTWMVCFWTGQVVQMLSADLLTYWRVLPVYMCVLALAVRRR